MTPPKWIRPDAQQKARGIIAVLLVPATIAGKDRWIPHTEKWEYTVLQMNRRIARGGSLPYWIVPNENYQEKESQNEPSN